MCGRHQETAWPALVAGRGRQQSDAPSQPAPPLAAHSSACGAQHERAHGSAQHTMGAARQATANGHRTARHARPLCCMQSRSRRALHLHVHVHVCASHTSLPWLHHIRFHIIHTV